MPRPLNAMTALEHVTLARVPTTLFKYRPSVPEEYAMVLELAQNVLPTIHVRR
jgi:hypothetical protein